MASLFINAFEISLFIMRSFSPLVAIPIYPISLSVFEFRIFLFPLRLIPLPLNCINPVFFTLLSLIMFSSPLISIPVNPRFSTLFPVIVIRLKVLSRLKTKAWLSRTSPSQQTRSRASHAFLNRFLNILNARP